MYLKFHCQQVQLHKNKSEVFRVFVPVAAAFWTRCTVGKAGFTPKDMKKICIRFHKSYTNLFVQDNLTSFRLSSHTRSICNWGKGSVLCFCHYLRFQQDLSNLMSDL